MVPPMGGPKAGSRTFRPAAVGGMFYPAEPQACRALAKSFVENAPVRGAGAEKRWLGGIVPHAGWVCSGAIAGQTIATLAASLTGAQGVVDVVVIFGAVHTPLPIAAAALDSHGRWEVPGGACEVPQELERKLTESPGGLFGVDDRFHAQEHAIEVELPLVQQAWPNAAVLPVEVPLVDHAIEIGRRTAREIAG